MCIWPLVFPRLHFWKCACYERTTITCATYSVSFGRHLYLYQMGDTTILGVSHGRQQFLGYCITWATKKRVQLQMSDTETKGVSIDLLIIKWSTYIHTAHMHTVITVYMCIAHGEQRKGKVGDPKCHRVGPFKRKLRYVILSLKWYRYILLVDQVIWLYLRGRSSDMGKINVGQLIQER